MPRSSRGTGAAPRAPTRPTVAPPPTRAPAVPQQRPMSTATHPPAAQQAPPPVMAQQSQGPGLFGQMASTAAGVAVGSSIGHAVGGLFGGWGSSSQPAPEAQQQQQQQPTYAQSGQAMDQNLYNSQAAQNDATGPCAGDIKNFTDCMNQNQGNMTICGWYLEQLKACQQASRQY